MSPNAEKARTPHSVAIIGAGVVGLAAALWLQRAGHSVTVVDPAPPLPGVDYRGASTYGNAAIIALSGCLPLAMPGIARQVPGMLTNRRGPLSILWRDLPGLAPWLISFLRASAPAEVDRIVPVLGTLMRMAEAGHAPLMAEAGVTRRLTGTLHLFRNAAAFAAAAPSIARRRREGVAMEMLDTAQIRAREPNLAPAYHAGILYPDCYSIDGPEDYARGMAQAVLARGGRIVAAPARGIESRAEGVSISAGDERLVADRVVIAAGVHSRELARAAGDPVRLIAERGYHVEFASSEGLLSTPVMYPDDGFFITPFAGRIRAAGTVELGSPARAARPIRCAVIEGKARASLPDLGARCGDWLGFRPSMPDSLPTVGLSRRDPRILYAFGHGHLGLTLGGITGRIIADLISDRTPPIDIEPLRPGRF